MNLQLPDPWPLGGADGIKVVCQCGSDAEVADIRNKDVGLVGRVVRCLGCGLRRTYHYRPGYRQPWGGWERGRMVEVKPQEGNDNERP